MQPNPFCLVDLSDGIESDVFFYPLLTALDALCSDPTVIWNRHANQVVSQKRHWKWIEEIQIHTAVLASAWSHRHNFNLEPVFSAGYKCTIEYDGQARAVGILWHTPKGKFRVGLKHAVNFRAR